MSLATKIIKTDYKVISMFLLYLLSVGEPNSDFCSLLNHYQFFPGVCFSFQAEVQDEANRTGETHRGTKPQLFLVPKEQNMHVRGLETSSQISQL